MHRLKQINPKLQRIFLLLLIIYILAAFLRVYRLGVQGLFFDEAHSWLTSQYPISDLVGILRFDNQFPFYFFLLKIYLSKVPHTEVGLRSFSVIFSLLSLVVLFWITHRWWGIKAALFASWLMAISSFEIYYAQDARTYALLNFQFLLSLALLLEMFAGRPKLLIIWAINLVFMANTHAYGLVLAGVQSMILGGLWIYGLVDSKRNLLIHDQSAWSFTSIGVSIFKASKWVLISGGIFFLGILPIMSVLLFTTGWRAPGGGVWIPRLIDLPILLNLATVGLTAGRQVFLDQNNLVFPFLINVPIWGWFTPGLIITGLAVKGIAWAWKAGNQQKFVLLVILFSLLMPIIIILFLGWGLEMKTWAQKSFLGLVLLFYILAGVGFSSLQNLWFRRTIVTITLGIALLSLIPYYTIWQKDNSRNAFHSLPQSDRGGVVLLEKHYISSLPYFYLGTEAHVIGLNNQLEDTKNLFWDTQYGTGFIYGYESLTCDDVNSPPINNVWIYGDKINISERLSSVPDCFGDAQLWIFEDGTWIPFEL